VEKKKVYVNRDGTATVVCPHCGTSKTVRVEKFRESRDSLKVRCTCQSEFTVGLEFRGTYRKEVELKGHYTKLPVSSGEMVVKDISLTGIGFFTVTDHKLKEGDEVTVKFLLDNPNQSQIKKKAIVRVIDGKYIGCEFSEAVQYDKDLGFYLAT
jgi:hypothetical protein